jgi:hypothetical protein
MERTAVHGKIDPQRSRGGATESRTRVVRVPLHFPSVPIIRLL